MQQGLNGAVVQTGRPNESSIVTLTGEEMDLIAAGSLAESMLIGAGAGAGIGSLGSPVGAAIGAFIGAGIGAATYYLP